MPAGMGVFAAVLCVGVLSAAGWSALASSSYNGNSSEEHPIPSEIWDESNPLPKRYIYQTEGQEENVTHHGHKKDKRKFHRGNIDKAELIVSSSNTTVDLYLIMQTDMCWKCPLVRIGRKIRPGKNRSFTVDSRWSTNFQLTSQFHNSTDSDSSNYSVCRFNYHFGEHGVYHLHYNGMVSAEKYKCELRVLKEPVNSFIPIYVGLGIAAALAIIWNIVSFIHRKEFHKRVLRHWRHTDDMVNSDLGNPSHESQEEVPPQPTKRRLRSLDTFRGLSLVIMVFVNYKGGYYWFFHHVPWNGLTVADLVFPWFTFIMGTSMALALNGQVRKGVNRKKLAWKVLKRSLILFFLGLLSTNAGSSSLDYTTLRIPGVLQRLAATYFVVAIVHGVFLKPNDPYEHRKWAVVRDILGYWPEWLIMISIVALHLFLTFLLHVPGCPTGYLGPGGLYMNGSAFNCTGGAAHYIDKIIFGDSHLYQHPTPQEVYGSVTPHDPEGSLGTLTSIFICFLGLQAGKIFLIYKDWVQRMHRIVAWAAITGLVAGILCKFTVNEGWIPVCKNLWSLSYVLSMASMAFILLGIFYVVIDVCDIWSGTPFFYPGMNSIVVYLLSETLRYNFPISIKVDLTHAAQLAVNVYSVTLWVLLSAVLYYKNIFIAI